MIVEKQNILELKIKLGKTKMACAEIGKQIDMTTDPVAQEKLRIKLRQEKMSNYCSLDILKRLKSYMKSQKLAMFWLKKLKFLMSKLKKCATICKQSFQQKITIHQCLKNKEGQVCLFFILLNF